MKFNIGYYKKPLTTTEIIVISVVYIYWLFTVVVANNSTLMSPKNSLAVICALPLVLWFIPLFTFISERWRNIYVLIPWLLMCVLVTFYKDGFRFGPLFAFVFKEIARFIYKAIFKQEPIFVMFTKMGHSPQRYNYIENRYSNETDKIFSLLVILIGISLTGWLMLIFTYKLHL